MTIVLAPQVRDMKPSASITAKKKVGELRAAGHQIVDFSVGEPDFDTPAHIIDAAIHSMRSGETHYTPTPGTPALRAAIVAKFRRDNNLSYGTENIVVGCGAKQIILSSFEATLGVDDEVIVPAPFWVSYPDMVKLFGGRPVIVTSSQATGFKLTPSALEDAITPKTRWLVLNSPNNPSGAVYSAAELKALADVLLRHTQVMVLTDDIYEHIVFAEGGFANIVQVEPRLSDRTLIVNGLSKAYAMTGWRVGYGAGPVELINAIVKLLGQSTTCASSISQAAAVAALDGKQTFVANAGAEYHRRRDRMYDLLSAIPGFSVTKPDGAFYLYPSIERLIGLVTPSGTLMTSDLEVSLYLLEEAKVAVLDGTAFGLSPYLRLSFATSMSAIEAGCTRIAEAVARLGAH